ncbi:hypothetical protein [Arthrobacter sp. G119Y2]|uniref:hypothetical protein n=1 Tax=Arthrobacter sp. G119Y2 TaxID=3134965 RepID=UPI003119872D
MNGQETPSINRLSTAQKVFAGLIALLMLGSLGSLALEGVWIGLVLVVALVGAVLLLVGPIRWLPGIALSVFALVPLAYTPLVNPIIGRYLTPVVFILLIWFLRTIATSGRGASPKLWLAVGAALGCWALLTLLWSIDPQRTLLWTASVCVVAVLPVFLSGRGDTETAETLSKCWLWLGFILGTMAIVEGISQQSFLASLYQGTESGGIGVSQNWSSIRSTTTLGHPLMNATFFAASSAYALMNTAQTRSRFALLSGATAAAGLVFTLSRSGVAALAVGLAIGTLAVLIAGKMTLVRKCIFVFVTAVAAVTVVSSPLVQARSNSAEGASSAHLRGVLLQAGLRIAEQDNFVGSGAGTSNIRSALTGMTLPLENSYAGVIVSSGLAGLFLLIVLFVGAILGALRRRRFDAAAGMVAFCVQIAGYPLVDNVPVALLIFGLLAYLGFHRLPITRPDIPKYRLEEFRAVARTAK